jgi:hypothetical protein
MAAELEEDETSLTLTLRKPETFFSEVYDFFAGGDNKAKPAPAPDVQVGTIPTLTAKLQASRVRSHA